MTRRQQTLGELELDVLKVVWRDQPCSVADVARVIAESHGHARTTVLTVMRRLEAKGFLTRRKRGGVYRYSTTQDRGKVLGGLIGQFVGKVLDGSPAPFVAYLAETGGLTAEQARALEGIARELEQEES